VIRKYVERGLRKARYDKLENGTFVAEVPGLRGVVATARSLEKCRVQLAEIIEEWVLVRVARGMRVPTLGGITVRVTGRP
jgi:predicted RNase H-like HicB family nuclease